MFKYNTKQTKTQDEISVFCLVIANIDCEIYEDTEKFYD